jgi:2-polyprenyl-3-methyl-5-hydroxy-6-metoxy-1,4-benzoquinol methylase
LETELYDYFWKAEARHWWFRARRAILADVLEGMGLGSDLRIADVGCGTGGMLPVLARHGRVTGVDDAPLAREYCARSGFPDVQTPAEWQSAGGAFDLVTAFDVIEHVEDDVAFLRSVSDRLVPGGRLLATVPAYPFLWSTFDEMNHHYRRYTGGALRRSLVASGFTVERLTHMNALLFPALAGARLLERAFGHPPRGEAERRRLVERWFRVGPLNGVLESLFASERYWLRVAGFPFGASILTVARKPA